MRILIIDSSKLIVERLEEIITGQQKEAFIDKAFSYNEAIELYNKNMPDAILLDSELQQNEALKFLIEVKAAFSDTMIIVLSVQTDKYIKDKWLSNGADYFFDKYHEFAKIVEIIKVGCS